MQTDYIERQAHHQLDRDLVEPEPPVSISHFTHVLRSYSSVILLSLAAIGLAYVIVATALYLVAPAERITSQPFRLDFEGAGQGLYPNKTKFNIADVISGPILTQVWQENRLSDYVPFGTFSRSVYVLESNQQYEVLAAEYQAKLADPRVTPVDRERLQKEFEMKAESIVKNEYSINIDRRITGRTLPEPLARKLLLDILTEWANFAVNQQHVIAYEVSVLSPEVLTPSAIEKNDLIASIAVLRSKVNRISDNIERIERLPGAKLARTTADHMSLEEARIRLDEIVRFRLEPLIASIVHSPSASGDRSATIRFFESQKNYDQRQLESAQQHADAFRESILMYEQPSETATTAPSKAPEQAKGSEPVVPQVSDTFLDRLMSLTSRAADAKYRQDLIDDYRKAVADTIPLRAAVAYDTALLADLHNTGGGGASINPAAVRADIEAARADIGQIINKMNELFQIVSRNMTPSTQLFTITGPPATRTVRAVAADRLALYGFLLLLISLPVVIVACLLHNRVREEEAVDGGYVRQERQAETLP